MVAASRVRRVPTERAGQDAVNYDDPMAPAVRLDIPLAMIPEEYVPESSLRLRLYRRIAALTSTTEVDTFGDEVVDRFGVMPEEVKNLLYQVRIKVLALSAGVSTIGRDENQLVLQVGRPRADRSAAFA